jgi:deoxyribodipyrimidine photo-lyase
LFNAENVEKFAPPAWFSRGTVLDTTYETIEILANSPAVVTQSSVQAFEWDIPSVTAAPLPSLGFVAPDANTVKDREVWLVHPGAWLICLKMYQPMWCVLPRCGLKSLRSDPGASDVGSLW